MRTFSSRADQIQAFRAHVAGEQAQGGDVHLGLRRSGHDRAIGVAHDDVANAHGGPAILGALDLRAADFDAIVAAEILLDRRNEPGRQRVDLDRTAGEPPPEREKATSNTAASAPLPMADAPDQAPMPASSRR